MKCLSGIPHCPFQHLNNFKFMRIKSNCFYMLICWKTQHVSKAYIQTDRILPGMFSGAVKDAWKMRSMFVLFILLNDLSEALQSTMQNTDVTWEKYKSLIQI